MAKPPEQRAAQRRLVGLINAGSGLWLDEERGLCIWRSHDAAEQLTGITRITDTLDALNIPYSVAIEKMFVSKSEGTKVGLTAQIARHDLGGVVEWMPSFQKTIDRAEEVWAEQNEPGA